MMRIRPACTLTFSFCVSLVCLPAVADEISFQRQIRPILSDKCFQCHGPDAAERQAGLRLDLEQDAKSELDSGDSAIVAGDLQNSSLLHRITTDDPDLVMPPPEIGKSLKPEEIDLLKQWIQQGAQWEQHWSFEPIVRPVPPTVPPGLPETAVSNEIDSFVVHQAVKAGLTPNQPAQRAALLRRVTFDLTGLPPSVEETEAFLADESEDAYEKVVDRLLSSKHYGEHRARYWLDAARYGDTHGLHLDNYREMWAYRDYVIDSFNDNKPFDKFTIEQLAGDLLDQPTDEQLIATGFNRCHVTTSEGGSIREEVHSRNVVERVVATGTVFMGLTMDCTRCHDHKFDPLSMQDFYSLYAFFNNLDANPLDGNKKDHAPILKVWTDEARQQQQQLQQQKSEHQTKLRQYLASIEFQEPQTPSPPTQAPPKEFVWIDDAVPEGSTATGDQPWKFVKAPAPVFSGSSSHVAESEGLGQHLIQGTTPPLRIETGDVLFAYVYLDPENTPEQIMLQWNDGSWEHRAYWGNDKINWGKNNSVSRRHMGPLPEAGKWVRLDVPVDQVGLKKGSKVSGWAFTQFGGKVYWDKAGKADGEASAMLYQSFAQWHKDQRDQEGKELPKALQELVKKNADQLSGPETNRLKKEFFRSAYVGSRDTVQKLEAAVAFADDELKKLEGGLPTTLIYRERKDITPAYILTRGEYDQKADQVDRATPAVLPAVEGKDLNRLDLARWLVSDQHPLTARVTVNRIWQQFFGTGLVKTTEDFGSQGELPSHPELLDWLAAEFRDPQLEGAAHPWDVRHIVKLIVMSSTYQQSVVVDDNEFRIDPENRLLARGPRYRLDAEMLRDQALSIGGLLVDDVGGPSVKPPQPDGLWFAVGYSGSNTVRFQADRGPDKVHRRTLYTFIKRTAPPPQMSTFDAPSRESCTVRRERTNSPLQALLLMNDPQYVECARGLAIRTMKQAGESKRENAAWMLRQAVLRDVRDEEVRMLVEDFDFYLADFAQDEARAKQLCDVGEQPPPKDLPPAELAAWTMVANLILNLDEVVNK